ncbi:MAG: type II toxin-antitoxin system HicA family toxin [Phycisphaerales bacterium]
MASEVRFAEIRKKLEDHGWTHRQGKGSHHVFSRKGGPTIVIPVHGNKVKPVYVREVDAAIRALQNPQQ